MYPEITVTVKDVASLMVTLGYYLIRVEAVPRNHRYFQYSYTFRAEAAELKAVLDAYHSEDPPLMVDIKKLRLSEIRLQNLREQAESAGMWLDPDAGLGCVVRE